MAPTPNRIGSAARQRIDRLIFLGPATLLLALFYLGPVIVDLGLAFSDMGRNLRVTEFTTENFMRVAGDRRLFGAMGTTLVYVVCTLAIFNVTYGLILAPLTSALPAPAAAFFRAVGPLPR